MSEIIVCRDVDDLSRRAATEFERLALESVTPTDRFSVALSGGKTPRALYSLLATSEFRDKIPWSKIDLFWGDERCVLPDHRDSNYGLAYKTLISRVPIPKENVYRMKGEEDPQIAAFDYGQVLRKFFGLSDRGLPRFDLIFLGLGEDGHTASLFPGSEVLREKRRLVCAAFVKEFKNHRLTLTLPVLNNAANIFFLVAGEDKASALRDVLKGKNNPHLLPAQRIKPKTGKVVWFVDQAAASLLADLSSGRVGRDSKEKSSMS
ncbi:MAG: 6-phosphogluconolactonase [Deltaproteobacteria bacterium]|nr:6-phosphogluconolactonase [Deltaproteobacteria bacterium]